MNDLVSSYPVVIQNVSTNWKHFHYTVLYVDLYIIYKWMFWLIQ